MSAAFIVVAGNAHYGPFPGVAEAVRWVEHPDRAVEIGDAQVVPLFGGLFLAPLDGEETVVQLPLGNVYPADFGLHDRAVAS